MPALLPMFGAEAMLAPAPDAAIWHHEGITKAAAHEAGLSKGAGANLAFQADAIDQYLHSPFWLLAGGLRRVRAIRRRRSAWETLHFDDLADGEAVAAEWERISGGAVCGVVWAATSALPREVRLRAAEHVIGLGMHAIQDFYSHSTWIDEPERRALTWQDERARARRQEGEFPDVLTGSYLHETPSGGAVHGGVRARPTVGRRWRSFREPAPRWHAARWQAARRQAARRRSNPFVWAVALSEGAGGDGPGAQP